MKLVLSCIYSFIPFLSLCFLLFFSNQIHVLTHNKKKILKNTGANTVRDENNTTNDRLTDSMLAKIQKQLKKNNNRKISLEKRSVKMFFLQDKINYIIYRMFLFEIKLNLSLPKRSMLTK